MNKRFEHSTIESKIYSSWEEGGLLKAPAKGEKYTVLMPPPNANASLHAGHGMYTIDDIVVRYKRLRGFSSQWIPGMDHAGFETQYVYEKQLAKEGRSRLDFDRKTLFENIFSFVKQNSGLIYEQFKRLGFLADWERSVFTLDGGVINQVYATFKKMVDDGLVYRDEYIVSYCVHCGTSLAELESKHLERIDSLYYVKYKLCDDDGFVTIATVRPEPIFIDTHLAVNPSDNKNKHLIGKKVKNPLTDLVMEIIADDFVDPNFGTGIVKLTPAHDFNDFEVARKHRLPIVSAIDFDGRIVVEGGKYARMKVKQAREAVVSDLTSKGLIDKIDDDYSHTVTVCYKCGRDLEPLTIPNWFIKVSKLKDEVIKVVNKDKINFIPKKFKKQILDWLSVMHDWPISRQIVWGIRIPVWYNVKDHQDQAWVSFVDKSGKQQMGSVNQLNKKGFSFEEIVDGLQQNRIRNLENKSNNIPWIVSDNKPTQDGLWLPETDTFDTWFSSGLWPLVTHKDSDSDSFPTDFMGTLSDILKFWISRMIMFSLYVKKDIPFKNVYLWSMVADSKGIKMSKSKGNVVNPIELVDKYGADAFRASLIFGIAQGGVVILAEDKTRAMRNFANKLWNIGRFIKMSKVTESVDIDTKLQKQHGKTVEKLDKELGSLKKKYIKNMDNFKFSRSFDDLYEFVWHRFADFYIEELKDPIRNGNTHVLTSLEKIFMECIKMLHPFVPFVTEAIWRELNDKETSILSERI